MGRRPAKFRENPVESFVAVFGPHLFSRAYAGFSILSHLGKGRAACQTTKDDRLSYMAFGDDHGFRKRPHTK